jgi:hypothetical protein
MIIEVGKTYNVTNANKKCVVEVEMYRHKDEDLKGVNTEIVWRTGEFNIEITSEEEAESLQDMIGEHGSEFCTDCFDTFEMESCWDGQGEDLEPWTCGWSSGEFEDFLNEYYDAEEGGYDFLMERDFEPFECIWYIANGIIVKETVV